MRDATPYKFELHEGWPPDGATNDVFGFDVNFAPCTLRWTEHGWAGVRLTFYKGRGWRPEAFTRGDGTERHVIQWAYAPVRTSDG